MFKEIQTILDRFSDEHRSYKTWQKIVGVLGCITIFCTIYALVLPALTLESSPDAICGLEEHTHTDECYVRTPVLICSEDHEHTEDCYRIDSVLNCGKEEHRHTAACFPKEEPEQADKDEPVKAAPDEEGEVNSTVEIDAAAVPTDENPADNQGEAKADDEAAAAEEPQVVDGDDAASEDKADDDAKSDEPAAQDEDNAATVDDSDAVAEDDAPVEIQKPAEPEEYATEGFGVKRSVTRVAPMRKVMPTAREQDLEGVETDKRITGPDADGIYTITMESFVTGNQSITITTQTAPVDVVLVLDQSMSMNDKMKAWQYRKTENLSPTRANNNANNYKGYMKEDLDPTQYKGLYVKNTETNEYVEIAIAYDGTTYTYTLADDPSVVIATGKKSTSKPEFVSPYEKNNVYYYALQPTEQSRMAVLKETAQEFVNMVNTNAKGADGEYGTADDVNHRIAIVGFSNSSGSGTEIIINGSTKTYKAAAEGVYGSALVGVDTDAGYKNVTASVKKLHIVGYTYPNKGLEMAEGIFKANPLADGEVRSRVVVFMTDGVPGEHYYWKPAAASIANESVTTADTLKSTYKATVYAIGIFGGADATDKGKDWTSSTNCGSEKESAPYANRMMQKISSNNGTPKTPSYYLSPKDSEELKQVFKDIATSVSSGGATVPMSATSSVLDIVSDYFDLPENADANSIKIYTEDCTGVDANNKATFSGNRVASSLKATITGKKITVTGFDFADNWCGVVKETGQPDKAHGKKLIIEVPVVPESDFIGGYDVPGNAKGSGIYVDGKMVEDFPPTYIDVTPNVTVSAKDITIYAAGKNIKISDLFSNIAQIKKYKEFVDRTKAEENTNTSYVFNIPGDSVSNTASGTYTLGVQITNTRTDETTVDVSKDANVHVLVPKTKWNDSLVLSGETYTKDMCMGHMVGEAEWVPDGNWKVEGEIEGTKPELKYTFVNKSNGETIGTDPYEIVDETKVDVTVEGKVGDNVTNLTDVTKFEWECGLPEGQHGNADIIVAHNGSDNGACEFYIHAYVGVELPATGGDGMKIWLIIGLTFMTAPVMIGLSIKRRNDLINVF